MISALAMSKQVTMKYLVYSGSWQKTGHSNRVIKDAELRD